MRCWSASRSTTTRRIRRTRNTSARPFIKARAPGRASWRRSRRERATLTEKPGVGCGAAILRDGRILLVERRKIPEAGHWNLPGGKVEFLERVEDAVLREIKEEIGVELALGPLLCVTEMIGTDGQHWLSPIYPAAIIRGDPANREPDKIGAI